jgi:PLP dependent protein
MSASLRLKKIQDEIEFNCELVGRNPNQVTLIAVSKTKPIEAIQELYDLGHRHFGESRVQELLPKAEALPKDIQWHFIGKLQSNKLRKVAGVITLLHTLESESQLKEIAKLEHPLPVLIEINIANEEQKSGILSKALDKFIQNVITYDQALLRGLMTIGPVVEDSQSMRPYFAEMRNLNKYGVLSMGMSADFDVAIQEGATHIRVGSSLFGERF